MHELTTPNITPLTEAENNRLAELEHTIEENLKGFLKIGSALREINESELYRHEHQTFDEYCQDRWDIGKLYAYRQIDAVTTLENLQASIPHLTEATTPTREFHLRPLTRLNDKQQVMVWLSVIKEIEEEGQKLTSGLVSRVLYDTMGIHQQKNRKEYEKRVMAEDRYTDEFRGAFSDFMDVVGAEMNKKWKETSREAVLHHLRDLINMIEEKDM